MNYKQFWPIGAEKRTINILMFVQETCTVSWPSWCFITIAIFETICNNGNVANNLPFSTFGENMRIPCTAEELEKFIGCCFLIGLETSNQRSFYEEDLSYTEVLSVLSINWFETFFQIIHVVENLSVDLKKKEDNKSVVELPECVPWSV